MKKAFTLSEALVTLGILGVLAAILIPVLDNVKPDKDKVMYKKAMYAAQSAVAGVMDDLASGTITGLEHGASVNATGSANLSDAAFGNKDFCLQVADALNTIGSVNCTNAGSQTNPNFITSDGVLWWDLGGFKFENTGTNTEKVISVARKGDDAVPLKIKVRYDGKVGTDGSTTFSTENEYLEDSFNISKKRYDD